MRVPLLNEIEKISPKLENPQFRSSYQSFEMANAVSLVRSSTTNFSNPPLNQLLNQLPYVKLDPGNYLLCQTLALPILKSYKLEGHLTGENPCPPKFITNSSGESQSGIDGTTEATGGASSSSTTSKNG